MNHSFDKYNEDDDIVAIIKRKGQRTNNNKSNNNGRTVCMIVNDCQKPKTKNIICPIIDCCNFSGSNNYNNEDRSPPTKEVQMSSFLYDDDDDVDEKDVIDDDDDQDNSNNNNNNNRVSDDDDDIDNSTNYYHIGLSHNNNINNNSKEGMEVAAKRKTNYSYDSSKKSSSNDPPGITVIEALTTSSSSSSDVVNENNDYLPELVIIKNKKSIGDNIAVSPSPLFARELTSETHFENNDDDDDSSSSNDDNNSNIRHSKNNDIKQKQQIKLSDNTFSQYWTNVVLALSIPIRRTLQNIAIYAATYPLICITIIITLSFTLIVAGFFSNFYIENNEVNLWKPTNSISEHHGQWIDTEWINDSDKENEKDDDKTRNIRQLFEQILIGDQNDNNNRKLNEDNNGGGDVQKYISTIIHMNGKNVLSKDGMERNFDVLQRIRSTSNYNEYCTMYGNMKRCPDQYKSICGLFVDDEINNIPICETYGITAFWLHDYEIFQQQVQTNQDVIDRISIPVTSTNGKQLNIKHILGYPTYDVESGQILTATSYSSIYAIAAGGESTELERQVLDNLLQLRDEWDNDPNNTFTLEVFATVSFPDEFNRGIVKDIPLLPVVFIIMSIFTCIAFSKKHDWVQSRSLLGFGAVACVLLSIMSGYGLLFIIGIPFTSLTQTLPFIMFGIGLDDSFILITAYLRTESSKDPIERIHDTMDEVGISIFMTTITSITAFALGCTSTLPAIRWLCLYAFPTIAIDFIYQITFFIALIVIDERRIRQRRKDCIICCKQKLPQHNTTTTTTDSVQDVHIAEKIMSWYSDILLRPWVKLSVFVAYVGLFIFCGLSAFQLELEFDFTSVLPSDSYIRDFAEALDYVQRPQVSPFVYFRYVDQSDPGIHNQMEKYVKDLVELDAVTEQPLQFWVRDYNVYASENQSQLDGLPFNTTLKMFLRDNRYKHYGNAMIFDLEGNVKASRTQIDMDRIDQTDVDNILDAFKGQRRITRDQPINRSGGKDWPFFNFDQPYYLWEFLAVTPQELKSTTIVGISAVTVMGILFLPHWSGVFFVFPMMVLLYVDLMGVLQMAGISINGVSFVALVMSIGLLVDFIMHVALRYYESKEEGRVAKTKDVLRTMGASILLGGLSTFLGVLPLALASNEVVYTIFITFVGIVTLGIGHGLMLLPVIMSTIGPNSAYSIQKVETEETRFRF